MGNTNEEQNAAGIPQEVQEEAKQIITDAFRLFADHLKRITDDIAEFDKTRKEVRGRIDRGARRTSGRIV